MGKEIIRRRRREEEDPNELEDEGEENGWEWKSPVRNGDADYLILLIQRTIGLVREGISDKQVSLHQHLLH